MQSVVEVDAGDRKIPAFIARPAKSGRFPVIFVNSEVFGVHEWIKDICRRLAKAGYVAMAPDLFVRAGDPSKLTDFAEVLKIVQATPEAQVTSDTRASLKYLAAQPFTDMKRLGVTGFCWGGGATWLCCERFPEFKAGVAWYGPLKAGNYPRTPPIDLVKDLHAPVLGLYGGLDKGIPQADVGRHARGPEGGRQDRQRDHRLSGRPARLPGRLPPQLQRRGQRRRLERRCWPSSPSMAWRRRRADLTASSLDLRAARPDLSGIDSRLRFKRCAHVFQAPWPS